MKSKQQSPCNNCMHRPVMSWGNACRTCMHKRVRCMHWPLTSQADACTSCMGSKVSSLSQLYLYSSYFEPSRPSMDVNGFYTHWALAGDLALKFQAKKLPFWKISLNFANLIYSWSLWAVLPRYFLFIDNV